MVFSRPRFNIHIRILQLFHDVLFIPCLLAKDCISIISFFRPWYSFSSCYSLKTSQPAFSPILSRFFRDRPWVKCTKLPGSHQTSIICGPVDPSLSWHLMFDIWMYEHLGLWYMLLISIFAVNFAIQAAQLEGRRRMKGCAHYEESW